MTVPPEPSLAVSFSLSFLTLINLCKVSNVTFCESVSVTILSELASLNWSFLLLVLVILPCPNFIQMLPSIDHKVYLLKVLLIIKVCHLIFIFAPSSLVSQYVWHMSCQSHLVFSLSSKLMSFSFFVPVLSISLLILHVPVLSLDISITLERG